MPACFSDDNTHDPKRARPITRKSVSKFKNTVKCQEIMPNTRNEISDFIMEGYLDGLSTIYLLNAIS